MNGPASGTKWLEPFAWFDRDTCSWRTCQDSLLEDSDASCTTWPKQGTWDRGFAYELPTSALLTAASESSSLLPTPSAQQNDGHDPEKFLARRERERAKGRNGNGFGLTLGMSVALLPTPSAYESTPTPEYVGEVQEHLDDPHKRLYLPGRKWHAQRTLSRIAPALLPTPGANDSTGAEGPTRAARRETGDTGGPALRDIGHLLPTPGATDGKGSDLPSRQGQPSLRAIETLLPTPTAMPSNRKSRRAMTSSGAGDGNGRRDGGGMSSPPGLEQTMELTAGIWPRDMPPYEELPPETRAIVDSFSGASTSPPSGSGNVSSDGELPGQLTIEDDWSPGSSSGCSDSRPGGSTCPE